MKRRTLLHNLFASIVAAPMLSAYERSLGHHTLVEPDDERCMKRAIQLPGAFSGMYRRGRCVGGRVQQTLPHGAEYQMNCLLFDSQKRAIRSNCE